MRPSPRLYLLVMIPVIALSMTAAASRPASADCDPLPLPGSVSLDSMETVLYKFLAQGCYYRLAGWEQDKRVRDTGPYINKQYYGPHPAVRVFYSPDAMRWLRSDRKTRIPDGAMMIKEMYDPPAVQYAGLNEDSIRKSLYMYTVMIRDSAASKDGWFWSFFMTRPMQPNDTHKYPFSYPNSGFGNYCVRCHSSAASENTFASLRNVKGEPGEPLQYRVDDSWRPNPFAHEPPAGHPQSTGVVSAAPAKVPSRGFTDASFFATFNRRIPTSVVTIPNVTYDHVISGPKGPGQFLTSDQCMSCHDGQGGPFQNMFLPNVNGGVNLSPFGEWSWSPMGLSGRDPVFYAQLESEQFMQPKHKAKLANLCLTCHGVMGQRQYVIDNPGKLFSDDAIFVTDPKNPLYKYGALARDGISCSLCHQIVDDKGPLLNIVTGRFKVSAPDTGISKIYGPFDDPTQRPMLDALGMQPEKSDYIKSARLCGSCHAVLLPVYNARGDSVGSFFEQATYLEWLNSDYNNESKPGAENPRTCQSCHMTTHYEGVPLEFRIANIQDQSYPEAENMAPLTDITVNPRKDFARHTLAGANPFLLMMFSQFDSILGVRKQNFMTYSTNGLPTAIAHAISFARDSTVRVSISDVSASSGGVSFGVRLENLTGHRFPTGVGFRRAFLSVSVADSTGRVLWQSGRSNDAGVIVDSAGRVLPSEFFTVGRDGRQQYQEHHQCIDSQSQVQIFQELVKDPQGKFTTSFVALFDVVKENRLLPHGWTKSGPPGFEFAKDTEPHGRAAVDPDFGAGGDVVQYRVPVSYSGSLKVTAALYYQTMPPSYLRDRFATAKGKSGDRLAYMVGNLNTTGTAIEGWKLLAGLDTASVVVGVGERTRMACVARESDL